MKREGSFKFTILEIPKANLISCGNQAFCKAAPVLWNYLTEDIIYTVYLVLFAV